MRIGLIFPYAIYRENYPICEDDAFSDYFTENLCLTRSGHPSDALIEIGTIVPEHDYVYMDDQYGTIDINADIEIAALSVMTMSADRAYELADQFRKRGVHVIMGGVHPTLLPDEALKHADTVVVGDGEKTWVKFLKDFKKGKAKSRYDGGVRNVKKIPPPNLSLLDRSCYFRKQAGKEAYSIHISSGCVRKCRYCVSCSLLGGEQYQKKRLGQIEAELDNIQAFGNDYFLVVSDDNPFLDPKFAKKVLTVVKDRKLAWASVVDVSIADDSELLNLIRDSGCGFLCLGLESLDVDGLGKLSPWKARFVSTYRDRIKKIQDHGVAVSGSFMIGLENDTCDTLNQYFDFFMETEMSGISVVALTPFPGTAFRRELETSGRLHLQAPWSQYTGYNLLFDHPKIEKDELYRRLLWFYQQFDVLKSQKDPDNA